jgi:cystathionine beta-lyase
MITGLNPQLTEIPLERLRLRRSAKWSKHPPDVLPAWVAEMDFPLAPAVRRALEQAIERDDCGYAAPSELGLGEAFARFAAARLGWEVDPAHVTPASDVVGALTALLRLIAAPGGRVLITPPVYHPFYSLIEAVGCEVARAPLRDGELDVDAIERELAAGADALILCSPHNPTGGVPDWAQLEAIADAAARHDAWVLADEIHAPLVLPGSEHVPFLTASPAAREHGIALSSASKAFNIPGLHCAQIVTASDRAAALVERLPHSATHCGQLGAIASVAAFNDGGEWLDDVIGVLDHNRGLLGELVRARLPLVGYSPPRAGYLAWLDVRELGLGEDPGGAILERGRLAVNSGEMFGEEGAGFVRLNIGTTPALVAEAVERLVASAADA